MSINTQISHNKKINRTKNTGVLSEDLGRARICSSSPVITTLGPVAPLLVQSVGDSLNVEP